MSFVWIFLTLIGNLLAIEALTVARVFLSLTSSLPLPFSSPPHLWGGRGGAARGRIMFNQVIFSSDS